MKSVLFISLVFYWSCTQAQPIDSFKLKDFRLPELHFQALDVNFNGNGSNHNFNIINNELQEFYSIRTQASLNFQTYHNTINRQSEFNLNQNLSLGFITNHKTLNEAINLGSISRYYKGKRFLGWQYDLAGQYNYDRMETIKYSNPGLSMAPGFIFGWGRVEEVTPAWHAWYMLETLQQQSPSARSPQAKDIESFGALVADLYRTRFYDFRLKLIEDLTRMDNYFQENELVGNRDISYFAHLNDMYLYSIPWRRWSGSRTTIFIGPSFSFNEYRQTSLAHIWNKDYRAKLKFSYEVFKPLNRFWQMNYYLHAPLSFGYSANALENNWGGIFQLGGGVDVAYFPTTRTRWNLSLNADQHWWKQQKSSVVRVGGTFNKYVTPRLGYFVRGEVRYDQVSYTQHPWYFNYNFGLNYAIF